MLFTFYSTLDFLEILLFFKKKESLCSKNLEKTGLLYCFDYYYLPCFYQHFKKIFINDAIPSFGFLLQVFS